MRQFAQRFTGGHPRGIALVMVLVVLTAIAAVSLAVMSEGRTQIMLTRNVAAHTKAEMLADAATHAVIASLVMPELQPVLRQKLIGVLDLYDDGEGAAGWLTETDDVDTEAPWRLDGVPYVWESEAGRLSLRITDERGKIDLNAGPDDLLLSLFEGAGLSDQDAAALLDAIADYQDADDRPRLRGAEDRQYAQAGMPYGAKDAPFAVLEDLMQVLGMDATLYARIAPALTVYSGQRYVNPASAPRSVLLALPGATEMEVESFLSARAAGQDPMSPTVGSGLHQARVGRPVYRLHVDVTLNDGARFVRDAVVTISRARTPAYTLLAWRQGQG